MAEFKNAELEIVQLVGRLVHHSVAKTKNIARDFSDERHKFLHIEMTMHCAEMFFINFNTLN